MILHLFKEICLKYQSVPYTRNVFCLSFSMLNIFFKTMQFKKYKTLILYIINSKIISKINYIITMYRIKSY